MEALFDNDFRKAMHRGFQVRLPNGNVYLAHPYILAYLADLPELAIITLTKSGITCPMCLTLDGDMMIRVTCPHNLHTSSRVQQAHAESRNQPKAEVKKMEAKLGVHLRMSPFWKLHPMFDVFNSLAVDSLHQLDIGVFGRHVMGALSDSLTSKSRELLNSRLRSVPCFSSRPIRLPSNGAAFESLTGHEWRSLLAVMPAILVGFFADPEVNSAVTKIFASFARLVNLLCIPISSDSIINAAEAEITTFFSLVPDFYKHLDLNMPQALTFHMIVHYPSSIRKFGTPMRTSTEVTVELPHKAGVKAPAKRTSNRTVLEHGAFRYVVARDAITRQFAFLATYHPALMRGRTFSRDLEALIGKIDSVRDLGLPGVPLERVRPVAAGLETMSVSDVDDDDTGEDAGGDDSDEDEFDPWEGDFDTLIEQTTARMRRAAKSTSRSQPQDNAAGSSRDTDRDLGLAKDVRLKEIASAGEGGEVRVKERGAVSLRFIVPKYRRRRKGVDLSKLEEDFPIATGTRDALARFVLTQIANPPLGHVNRQAIERVLPHIHSVRLFLQNQYAQANHSISHFALCIFILDLDHAITAPGASPLEPP
ncbi:hypothetical protein BCR44DRAFT_1494774 [Catenaria anguillulae PL171]|uniref:Uncharacterized protein n=1 Tax=Catenaria anguillulae PL171 TaxID=765915 RepID=A0A1Y2I305_9FUNG|nr:hypothetical protein BCR44DRAFT_1494774 [Catenaria anguillulae PL171]